MDRNGELQPAAAEQPVVMAETLVDITALNRSSHPATLFYVADVEGSEPVPYATLEPNERKSQQSFAGHRWRLTCNGCATSTELCATPDLELRIGGCACGDAPIPEEFYHHSKLVGVAGLRVRAAAVVSADAVDAAAKILAEMLRHCPPSILTRLDAAGCAVSVIGREQKTSDIPEHRAWARECATSGLPPPPPPPPRRHPAGRSYSRWLSAGRPASVRTGRPE